MYKKDAEKLMAEGRAVRLQSLGGVHWRNPSDIPHEYHHDQDFIDMGDEHAFYPCHKTKTPRPCNQEGNNMTQIQVKKAGGVEFACKIGSVKAEFIMATEIKVSDPTAAIVVHSEPPKVYGIKEAAGLTLEVKGLAKVADGNCVEVQGTSNPFDIVAPVVELVPVLDDAGNPKPELDANGLPVLDPATGTPKMQMEPATPKLEVSVSS